MQRFSKVNMSQSHVEGPRKGNMRIFHSDSQTLPQDFNLVHHLHNLPLFLGNSLLYFSRSRNALKKHRKREWWFTEKKKKKVKIDLITLYIYRTNTFSQFPNHFLSLTTQVVGYQGKHGKGVYEQSSLNQ